MEKPYFQSCMLFQSTLPSRGTIRRVGLAPGQTVISIHVPLMGSTPSSLLPVEVTKIFQSTPPTQGAIGLLERRPKWKTFQSELPSRGAMICYERFWNMWSNFNPRSHTGSDAAYYICCRVALSFQSTLPSRGAMQSAHQQTVYQAISIHAPLTGSDPT